MRSLVSLWFPDFPVERFTRARIRTGRKAPPRGLPFALVESGRSGLRLIAVNATARDFGLMRGMRLADARAQFSSVKVFKSDFRPMQNMFSATAERGYYKLVVDGASDRVLGVHMLSPEAPEILQAAAIAVKAGLTKAQFDATVALHPSMAEELVLMR